MKVYDSESGMYAFVHLPAFAEFVLTKHLEAFADEQLLLSQQMDIPVLKHLAQFTHEQLLQQLVHSSAELLRFLASNKAKASIEESMKRWLSNQLPLISKFQILAEDITSINYVRQEALKKFIPFYTTDLSVAMDIVQEIDRYVLGNNTTATNTYIKILKDQLQEETHFSNNVVQASPAIIYIFDLLQHRGVYVSGKVEEVMGYAPQDVLELGGNIIPQLAHPDDVALMQAGLEQMVRENSERTFMAEFRMKDKTGHYHWLRSYLVVFLRDEEGRPAEVLGQVYEVSKEKELVQAVEKRERQMLEAQSIARLGSFDWELVSGHTEYTPEMRNIFETEQPQGYEQLLERVHPDDKERVKAAMTLSLQTGVYECEFRYRIHQKEKVLWAKGLVVFESEKPVRMIGTVQDVTERKRIEESLVEKTLALQKSNASLQEFASVASHDLKEPLRKISTFSDLLRDEDNKALSQQGKLYVQKISDSAGRMRALIDDILAYSSLSGEEAKERVSLYQIVQDVLSTLELPLKEKAVQVEVSHLPEASVYPLQMMQLFQNLLSNALKFSRMEVPLQIRISHNLKKPAQINGFALRKAASYLQIEVADNGIGFNNEAAEKIFGLFSRLHSRSQFEGTGLGLAICRKVAENHGGTIYASSHPGQGAVFTVLLPVE